MTELEQKEPTEEELIYDWDDEAAHLPSSPPRLVDHTLSASELAPSARRPELAVQVEVVRELTRLGIADFCLGSLGASQTRTLRAAIQVDGATCWVEQPTMDRLPADTLCYISQRQKSWAERLKRFGAEAVVVIHDATRCHPQHLQRMLRSAGERGALGVCLNDDTGRAIPAGVTRLVGFARETFERLGYPGRLEWSGRNDRSLALPNALAAWRAGATVLHSSLLGVGEGAGLVPTEQLLVNLSLFGALRQDLRALSEVSQRVTAALGLAICPNQPIIGEDAFRTGTGVHAAAIVKARQKGHEWLADLVYSGVPASRFGFHQIIEIGPMAGASNAQHWLREHGYEATPERVSHLLERAKRSERVLSDAEIRALLSP